LLQVNVEVMDRVGRFYLAVGLWKVWNYQWGNR